MSKKIISFTWDNGKCEDWNGQHLMIGQHLPKTENDDATHVNIYGISLDIADSSKDFQLKNISCYSGNLTSEIKEITKAEAREMLIKELDKALEIMFDVNEIETIERSLNVDEVIDESEETED